MAGNDLKISALPVATAIADTDQFIVRPSAGPVKNVTALVMESYFGGAVHKVIDAHANGVEFSNSAATNKANLQALIDSLTDDGGTIVLAEAVYCDSGLTLKYNVHLQGNNIRPGRGPRPKGGGAAGLAELPACAAFMITDTVTPFIELQSETSMSGITFYYPGQNYGASTLAACVTYPPTIKKKDAGMQGVRLDHLVFVGASKCISFLDSPVGECLDIEIDACYGYPLAATAAAARFIEIEACVDVARVTRCHVSPGAGSPFIGIGGTGGCPISDTLWNNIIHNGGPAYEFINVDDFMVDLSFAFGVNTGFKSNHSYGRFTDCGADTVYVGAHVTGHTSFPYEWVTLTNFHALPHGGTTQANRISVLFDGVGNVVNIVNLHTIVGAPAHASIKINGTGTQRVNILNANQVSTGGGSFTHTDGIDQVNGSAVVNGTVTNY